MNAGQQIHHIGAFGQWNPVELHVLAGGEMAGIAHQRGGDAVADLVLAALGVGDDLALGRVVLRRHLGQHPQLGAVEFAVGHGHAQHGRIALHIPAVLQAQGPEIVVRQRTGLVTGQLVAVLGRARLDKLTVKLGVLVHGKGDCMHLSADRAKLNVARL